MSVQSKPLNSKRSTASSAVSIVGVIFLLISIGPLFLLLNGGYSILGMAWLGAHTGEYGRLFWSIATFWTADIPIAEKAGLPLAQPVLPWIMVGGISFLEIGLFLHRLRNGQPEWWIDGGGSAASIFDYLTTMIGLMFAPFAANAPSLARIIWYGMAIGLAIPLTFGFEGLLARALKGR